MSRTHRLLPWLLVLGGIGTSVATGAPPVAHDAERAIALHGRYLNFPVKHGAFNPPLTVTIDGKEVRSMRIELTDGKPDFWVALDAGEWNGRTATVPRLVWCRRTIAASTESRPATRSKARKTSIGKNGAPSSISRPAAVGSMIQTAWFTAKANGTCFSSTTPGAGTGAT